MAKHSPHILVHKITADLGLKEDFKSAYAVQQILLLFPLTNNMLSIQTVLPGQRYHWFSLKKMNSPWQL